MYLSIYLSQGSVCPFQCSREVENALFSTCAQYNWRLVSNKIPGILAMMQMTQRRQQQRSETPEKQQLYTTRPLPESDDERQSHPINVKARTTGATKGISTQARFHDRAPGALAPPSVVSSPDPTSSALLGRGSG